MLNRRPLLALPALLATHPGTAMASGRRQDPPALATPRPVRLRPGTPPLTLHSAVAEVERRLDIRFSGAGAPETVFRFTSWYGYARVFAVLPLRGCEAVLAAFEGNTGTGVYQELQALIAQGDDGAARILALETLRARETPICEEAAHLAIRMLPLPDGGGVRLEQVAHGVFGTCDPRRRPTRFREAWGTVLRWDGHGAMQAAPASADAGPSQRKVDAARRRTMAWLAAAPRSVVTSDDLDRLGLMEVVRPRDRGAAAVASRHVDRGIDAPWALDRRTCLARPASGRDMAWRAAAPFSGHRGGAGSKPFGVTPRGRM